MKGIILAGGKGTRLYPSTIAVSKQMLNIYDKPMIYYPLSTLMLAGITDILIISDPISIVLYQNLLSDGSQLGLNIQYSIQKEPRGLAEAFIIAEDFIQRDNVCLILGDNIFYGYGFSDRLKKIVNEMHDSIIFGYHVSNPRDFGVVEFDEHWNVLSIEEKPLEPKSNYAIPGIYFFDSEVCEIAKSIKPSERNELEITSVINEYRRRNSLKVHLFGRGMAWLDTGTHKSMLEASNFVEAIQSRQGQYIACVEEIAYREGLISVQQLELLGKRYDKNEYGSYILRIVKNQKKGGNI